MFTDVDIYEDFALATGARKLEHLGGMLVRSVVNPNNADNCAMSYLRHRDKRMAWQRAYYADNKEAHSKTMKSWYQRNKERLAAKYQEKKRALGA